MAAWVRPILHAKSRRPFGVSVQMTATLVFSSQLALAQFAQQGPKLSLAGICGACIRNSKKRKSRSGFAAGRVGD
jgi:hypothetical protein